MPDRRPGRLAYFGAFAAQMTQALRRRLAYKLEQSTSQRLQRSLLPQSLPDLAGLSVATGTTSSSLSVPTWGQPADIPVPVGPPLGLGAGPWPSAEHSADGTTVWFELDVTAGG